MYLFYSYIALLNKEGKNAKLSTYKVAVPLDMNTLPPIIYIVFAIQLIIQVLFEGSQDNWQPVGWQLRLLQPSHKPCTEIAIYPIDSFF